MSHVAKVEIEVTSLEALEKAAKECGLVLNRGQKTYRWYGRWMNDYNNQNAAFKNGIDPEDYGKCDHTLAIPGNEHAYEVGVVRNKDRDGYSLVWDFWQGGHGLEERIGEDGMKLMNQYAKHVAIEFAETHGHQWQEEVDEDGDINILIYDYS